MSQHLSGPSQGLSSNDQPPPPPPPTGNPAPKRRKESHQTASPTDTPAEPPTKSKRVRTGCLTCRERHLKCDEATPDCLNCRKSNRECKRGVRLNFIDVQVRDHMLIPKTSDWAVSFQDESRLIAGEYQGGLSRYPLEPIQSPSSSAPITTTQRGSPAIDSRVQSPLTGPSQWIPINDPSHHTQSYSVSAPGPPTSHPFLSAENTGYKPSSPASVSNLSSAPTRGALQPSILASGPISDGPVSTSLDLKITSDCEYVSSPEELGFLQVYVREVGVWMDWLDREKHFSQSIPYISRKSDMLYNACLACGALHMSLMNNNQPDASKSLNYYNTATTALLLSLRNPDREEMSSAECATTATVLHVYEMMNRGKDQNQTLIHTIGARALIKECRWNAQSKGIGGACFWLNIGLEVLSCLQNPWSLTWNPDEWKVNMDYPPPSPSPSTKAFSDTSDNSTLQALMQDSEEEVWVHRMVYIVGKIVDYKARFYQESRTQTAHDKQVYASERLAEWQSLKRLCDEWNEGSPQFFRPLGYLYTSQTRSRSAFPEVWLVKPTAIVARLFFHTAQCLLASTHPIESSPSSKEMHNLQIHHAHQLCGILAHTDTRGLTCVAGDTLVTCARILTEKSEQDEVLEIVDRLARVGCWPLGHVSTDLKRAWGWEPDSDEKSHSRTSSVTTVPQRNLPTRPPTQKPSPSSHQIQMQAAQLKQAQAVRMAQVHAQAHLLHVQAQAQAQAHVFASQSTVPFVDVPVGIGNPLREADFKLPNHPYQNWYLPRNDDFAYDG